jgi:hypothetical protein
MHSVVLFDEATTQVLTNNFTGSRDALLHAVLHYRTGDGKNFSEAIRTGKVVMEHRKVRYLACDCERRS